MNQQNYENHRKLDPVYHVGIGLSALITLILTVVFFVKNVGDETLISFIVLFLVFTVIMIGVKVRTYALQVQDRVIRTEEQFRYYRLTGKELDSRLELKQIIALRFAPDEEFPALVERAVSESLSPNDIKLAVQNWRGDHHRV
ncbi:DUF6526 family protein [Bacillus sp. KH172YL63]|uniref:DUF6526 family protein n=1 Tax=Bacillus sp. KH172YL63 TaxID=2709784 RepID=UPI0013E4508D|nr:DUF6526 family protein [Bacillus sp. KH172YL63]BCB04248.1 hypothetical protein KH172YL63_23810 [Bacillus sp. KH172YL63]